MHSSEKDGNEQKSMLVIHSCMTLDAQWDFYRTFEAVVRLGSLTAAARSLELSQSTVSRHLQRLEEIAGSPLLLRQSPLRLTERGEALFVAIEPMVTAALSARAALADTPELHGLVTLTTVPEVLRWSLVPELDSFYRAYPHLRLRLLATNQVLSLAADEADLAIRFARPNRGDLVSRKLGTESFAIYRAVTLDVHLDVPWLGLAGTLARIPEQRQAERLFASRMPRLLVEDLESLGIAIRAGLGVGILPRRWASRMPDISEVDLQALGLKPSEEIAPRDFWLVVHQSKQRLPQIRAVKSWLENVFRDSDHTGP